MCFLTMSGPGVATESGFSWEVESRGVSLDISGISIPTTGCGNDSRSRVSEHQTLSPL
jgi:hypothetical protein